MPDEEPPAEYDPDGVYLTTKQAAEHCGVSEAAIRKWVQRKHLKPIRKGPRSPMLFTLLAVAEAEKKTAVAARRLSREHSAA